MPHTTIDHSLYEKFRSRYADLLHPLACKERTTLLEQGCCADRLYAVESGVLRLWHNTGGKDVTLQFFQAGQLAASFESFYLERPSNFSLEAVTDCTLTYVNRDDFFCLLDADARLQREMCDYICARFIDYTNLFLSRIQRSPEERYRELLASQPELFKTVPQHDIASYLGISAVSLSRIRRRAREKS